MRKVISSQYQSCFFDIFSIRSDDGKAIAFTLHRNGSCANIVNISRLFLIDRIIDIIHSLEQIVGLSRNIIALRLRNCNENILIVISWQPLRLVCRVHVEIHGTPQANFFYAEKR